MTRILVLIAGAACVISASSDAKEVEGPIATVEAYTHHDHRSTSGFCTNRIAFTPNAGGYYSIKQVAIVDEYCRMEVVDMMTGKAPADLEHVAPGSCKTPEKKKDA